MPVRSGRGRCRLVTAADLPLEPTRDLRPDAGSRPASDVAAVLEAEQKVGSRFVHDRLTQTTVLIAPGRIRPAHPNAFTMPSPDGACVFCPHTPASRAPVHERPVDVVAGEDGAWSGFTVANRFPLFAEQFPAVGHGEVIVAARRHVGCWSQLTTTEATGAVMLLLRAVARGHASLGGSSGSVVGFSNVGVSSGASQPHLHAQVVVSRTPLPALVTEAAACALDQPGGCAVCEEQGRAAADGRDVLAVGRWRVWVPAAPVASHELRLAAAHGPSVPADAANLAQLLRTLTAAQRHVLGPVGYNVVLHSAPAGPLHAHVHLLGRDRTIGGFELLAGMASVSDPPRRYAAALRSALAS